MSGLKCQVQICKLSFYKCQGRGAKPRIWASNFGHNQELFLPSLLTAFGLYHYFGTKVLLPCNVKAN